MRCEQVVEQEVAERYLLDALSEPDREAFEGHYFECERCFGSLETLRALRVALAEGPAAVVAAPRPRRRWRPWVLAAAAAIVVSVGSALYWSLASRWAAHPRTLAAESGRDASPPPEPSSAGAEAPRPVIAEAGPPEQSAPAGQQGAALAALAAVRPPAYAPLLLRGAQDEATRHFRAAMEPYLGGRFAEARSGLEAAAALHPADPDIAFFLGICELLTDRPAPAIEQLRRTLALGESPYVEEARIFLAKAHLKLGDPEAASVELEAAIRERGDHEREARDLLRRLEELRGGR